MLANPAARWTIETKENEPVPCHGARAGGPIGHSFEQPHGSAPPRIARSAYAMNADAGKAVRNPHSVIELAVRILEKAYKP